MLCRVRRAPGPLVVLSAAIALAGCGAASDRDVVRAYIKKANAIQGEQSADLAAANAAYVRLSQGKLTGPAAIAGLQTTVDELRTTRERLARLAAPALADALRRALLRVFEQNIDMANEAALLAVYVPSSRRAMATLGPIGARLRRGLSGARTPAVQARALADYADRLERLENRMRRLSPPPVLLVGHRNQLLRLATARALTARLRAAIGRRDGPAVAALLVRFRSVYSTSSVNLAVQRAAVRAYRRRVTGINRAVGAVQREQQRLEASLG